MRRMSPKRRGRLAAAGDLVRTSTFAGSSQQDSTGSGIRPKIRAAVLTRDGYACVRCGRECLPSQSPDIHHRLARSAGGPDTMSNLITLCRPCHTTVHGRSEYDAYDGYWIRSGLLGPTDIAVFYHGTDDQLGQSWYLHDDGSLSEEPQQ